MRVLVIVHGLPPQACGGSEIHAWDLARALATRHGDDVLVLTREAEQGRPERSVRHEVREGVQIAWINNTFADIRAFSDNYDDDRITSVAERVIDRFMPDVAHVHHLTCLSTGLVRSLAGRRIPLVMTLHDYWLLCHRGQLLDIDGNLCGGQEPDGCQRCLGPAASLPAWTFVARRRSAGLLAMLPQTAAVALRALVSRAGGNGTAERDGSELPHLDEPGRRFRHMRALAGGVDRFLVPSRFLLQRFVQAGFPAGRLLQTPYGVDHERFSRNVHDPRRAPTAVLRIGFLGTLMISKGVHVLLEAIAKLPPGSVTVDLFGDIAAYHGDTGYGRQLAPLLSAPGVRLHGPVPHDRVPSALSSIDVLVVPSIWPENSPLVIREAFAAGVPVVASDAGGISETVADGAGGLLFRPGDAGALAGVLKRLVAEPELLDELRRSIPALPSLADELRTLRETLQSLVAASPNRGTSTDGSTRDKPESVMSGAVLPASPGVSAVIVHYHSVDDTGLAIHSLRSSNRRCDRIVVVDNDGDGRARDTLTAASVDYVAMPANVGFPAGVNEGLRRAFEGDATRVLLLNSDAVVRPDCIDEMERVMDECRAAVVGPVVLSRADPDLLLTAGIAFDEATGRMTQPGSGAAFDAGLYEAARAVDAVSGCVMLIDRAVVERIGFFDPEYFFGFEDIDFCLRARSAGFPVALAGRAIAYHQGSQSMGATSPDRFYYAVRNHLRLSRRIHPHSAMVPSILRSGVIVGLNVAHAARATGGSLGHRLGAVGRGTADAVRGRYGRKPT